MRVPALFVAALAALSAAPALAAEPRRDIVLPPELSDPAMGAKVGQMMGALAKAMMDLPIGEIEAAAEGRPATPADRAKRVRDVAGGPGAEQRIAAEAAASGAMMQAATQALVRAMPAILQAMDKAEDEIARATANLPSPTYPNR